MTRNREFRRGRYFFRPYVNRHTGRPMWEVTNGIRFLRIVARIRQASDGESYLFSVGSEIEDARPSFAAACDAVMAQLPIAK